MSCVRCGRCCFYLVIVVSPEYSEKENLDLEILPEKAFICVDGEETICPHLTWDDINDVAICKIHDKPWFKYTSCYRHNNPEFGEIQPCRIGPTIRNHSETFNFYKNFIKKNGGIV